MIKKLKPVLLLPLFISACATSPLGRKQFTLMPDSQMNLMGIQSFEELKAKTPIEKDPSVNRYVQCVTQPILKSLQEPSPEKSWEVVVFKAKDVNAFALPGGKIGIYTGILEVLKTDAQLAAVVGHEVGHVIARHGNERVSQSLGASLGMAVVDLLTGKSEPQTKQLIMGSLGLGIQFGLLLPFSRTHENESDIIGLNLMAKAGFDPREAVEVWKNMSANHGGSAPPEFFSTHPSDQTRIKNIESHLPGVLPIYEESLRKGRHPHCKKPT